MMRRDRLSLVILAGLALHTAAVAVTTTATATDPAAAVPDLLGVWKSAATSIVTGGGAHHPADAPPPAEGAKPRLRAFTGTMQVTGQEGERFWGTIGSPPYKEDLIGIFTGEGGRFLFVDGDGFLEGEVIAPGNIRYCYRHITPTSRVVACGAMTRE